MDNFCTIHQIGEVVKTLTDGKTKVSMTQKKYFIDTTNQAHVKKSIAMIYKLERGHGHLSELTARQAIWENGAEN